VLFLWRVVVELRVPQAQGYEDIVVDYNVNQ
jgi:hypothetical protein